MFYLNSIRPGRIGDQQLLTSEALEPCYRQIKNLSQS
jgi:hypothetical protein